MKLWNSWIAIGTPISIWEHGNDFVYEESDFWNEKNYELSFGKNEFWNFARKYVNFKFLGNVSKFVFAETQVVEFFISKIGILVQRDH